MSELFYTVTELNTCNVCSYGLQETHEDERTVLFKTISLDGIKPNTNPKTNPIQLFCVIFEHRPLIFSLAVLQN